MAIFLLIIIVAVVAVFIFNSKKDFDDPKPMSNQHLLSAIAGQADWLEKMSRSPSETQTNKSIIEIAGKRKSYISRLCQEVIDRGITGPEKNEPKYPGATKAPNIFEEVAEFSKELECKGIAKNVAVVRAVKEKLFIANGANYSASGSYKNA